MKKFTVYVPELHYQAYEVEADDAREAAQLAHRGECLGHFSGAEYERTLGPMDGFEEVRVHDGETGEETFQPVAVED